MHIYLASPQFGIEEGLYPNLLYSYAYLQKFPKTTAQNLLLDSGAYTWLKDEHKPEEQVLEYARKYCEYLLKNKYAFNAYVELDLDRVYGNAFLAKLRDLFRSYKLRPMPVWHEGQFTSFQDLCNEYDYVGFGSYQFEPNAVSKIYQYIEIAEKKGVRLHLFGFTSADQLAELNRFPSVHSVDSTSWKATMRFGRIFYAWNKSAMKLEGIETTRIVDTLCPEQSCVIAQDRRKMQVEVLTNAEKSLLNIAGWRLFQEYIYTQPRAPSTQISLASISGLPIVPAKSATTTPAPALSPRPAEKVLKSTSLTGFSAHSAPTVAQLVTEVAGIEVPNTPVIGILTPEFVFDQMSKGAMSGDLVPTKCPKCKGVGLYGLVKCDECQGDGIITVKLPIVTEMDKIPLQSFPPCKNQDGKALFCPECFFPQYATPSGSCCENGHGGLLGILDPFFIHESHILCRCGKCYTCEREMQNCSMCGQTSPSLKETCPGNPELMPCFKCKGNGMSGLETCFSCQGKGVVMKPKAQPEKEQSAASALEDLSPCIDLVRQFVQEQTETSKQTTYEAVRIFCATHGYGIDPVDKSVMHLIDKCDFMEPRLGILVFCGQPPVIAPKVEAPKQQTFNTAEEAILACLGQSPSGTPYSTLKSFVQDRGWTENVLIENLNTLIDKELIENDGVNLSLPKPEVAKEIVVEPPRFDLTAPAKEIDFPVGTDLFILQLINHNLSSALDPDITIEVLYDLAAKYGIVNSRVEKSIDNLIDQGHMYEPTLSKFKPLTTDIGAIEQIIPDFKCPYCGSSVVEIGPSQFVTHDGFRVDWDMYSEQVHSEGHDSFCYSCDKWVGKVANVPEVPGIVLMRRRQ